MNQKEKLLFLHKLICSNYSLSLWSYNADFELLDTTATWDLISVSNFIPAVSSHLASGSFSPLILETNVGMLWIIGFAHKNRKLENIHFLGPAVTGKDTSDLLRQKLETYELSVRTHSIVSKMIAQTPLIPNGMLANYAIMLHYALNDETLPLSDVKFFIQDRELLPPTRENYSVAAESLWKKEQMLCQMFENGDYSAVSAIISLLSISSGVKSELKDTVRKNKNNALVLLTLCSRSCIHGGLHPSAAFDLHEYYAFLLEECRTTGEVIKFCKDMVYDFMSQVRHAKTDSSISPPIQNICYYIQKHLAEPLCMKDLAKLTGYTEYYFSHKFQKETGVTVKDYILNEKISQAKLLLTDSSQSIQEISDALGFCNRSYFSTCFMKKVGVPPSQYKLLNAKI